MATYFVSAHQGALDWARRRGIEAQAIAHLDADTIANVIVPGDIIIGTLPIQIAAQICARSARYLHLSMNVSEKDRRRELTADEMVQFGARLEEYVIKGPVHAE